MVALDVTAADAPARVAEVVRREHGALHLLVNNAGTAWRGTFDDTGWENVRRHMELNFEAPLRMTEALLPLLRETAAAPDNAGASPRISIVNVASTAARVSRPRSGAYSASKFALAGWSDALYGEERPHGVHVGLVLPGFVETEGFPATELHGQGDHSLVRLTPRGRRRGDPRRRARAAGPSATSRARTGSRRQCGS